MKYNNIESLKEMPDNDIEDVISNVDAENRPGVVAELESRGILAMSPNIGESATVALIRGELAHPDKRVVVITDREEKEEEIGGQPNNRVPQYPSDDVSQINGGWLPPIGTPRDSEVAGAVNNQGACELRTLVQWVGATDDDPFCHQVPVASTWVNTFTHHCAFPQGAGWGYRTPIVHAALAGLDTSNSGFDDAAMRALSALETFVNSRRGEFSPNARSMINAAIKRRYNPAALLLRGALLWYGLLSKKGSVFTKQPWMTTGSVTLPAQMDTADAINGLAVGLMKEAVDVVYTRLIGHEELYMLDVLLALCSDMYPLQNGPGVSKLWPKMVSPRVVYSGAGQIGRAGGQINAQEVWDTMQRYCNIWDCHDLFAICLNTVQSFALRPIDAGWLAGSHKVYSYWPNSDLFAGVIGPFVAGITPEGMKTVPFNQPAYEVFTYGAAVKGCMLTAAYMRVLQEMHEAHPVALATGTGVVQRLNSILHQQGAEKFCRDKVGEVLKEAGWNFVDDGIASIGLGQPRDMLKTLLDTSKVPWWINVVRHLSSSGLSMVKDWLVPAVPDKTPEPNEWCLFRHIGATTEGQVAGAIMWAGARLRYRVELPNMNIRVIKVDTNNWSRFPPRVSPNFTYGRCHGEAALCFDVEAVGKLKLMAKLRKSKVELLPIHATGQWYVMSGAGDTGGPSEADIAVELRDAGLMDDDDFDYKLRRPRQPGPVLGGAGGMKDVLSSVSKLTQWDIVRRDVLDRLRTYGYSDPVPDNDADHVISAFRHINIQRAFGNVPIGSRLEAAQEMLKLLRSLAPYATRINQDNAREAVTRLIAAIQLFKKDPAVTIEEAGGAPDDLEALAKEPYNQRLAVDRNLAAGVTIKEMLEQAVAKDKGVEEEDLVDDPELEQQTLENFGEGTSQAGLKEDQFHPAGGASVPSGAMETIGFAPPPPSAD